MLFISDAPKSYLVDISEDKHPQYKCTFGGKSAHKEPECIDAEEWIAKKGITAKGKKCHDRETVKKVEFVEPLVKPEDEVPEEPMEIILPDEEDLSLPTGEIVLPDPDEIVVSEQDKDVPELIIEEPTLF
jgi:topoisomerase-4 subunit A